MTYYEIKIECEAGKTEEIENFLIINDITDYFVSDPQIEQEILKDMPWLVKDELMTGNAFITVCLSEKEEAACLFDKLISEKYAAEMRNASDDEWKDNWKQFAKVVRVTDDLVIKPAWVDYERKENEKIIELDSGAAFGTGTHETTHLCAQLLAKYEKSGCSLLDIGTGSGILAIIGASLGFSKIVATDIDSTATETAKINIEKNNFSKIIDVRQGDLLDCVTETFDVITANIIVDVLVILLADVKKYLNENGKLILSGILTERSGEVITAAEQNGFTLEEQKIENDWTALVFAKT